MLERMVVPIAFVTLLLAGCASVPTGDITLQSQAAPRVDFSAYKTYAWMASEKFINDPAGAWVAPQFDANAEIKWLIDREMRARAISEVTAFPDMFVAFVAGVDMTRLALKEDPAVNMEVLKNVPKGALMIMLIDGASGDVMWVATAVGNVGGHLSAEERKARFDYAVTAMFKTLPGSATH